MKNYKLLKYRFFFSVRIKWLIRCNNLRSIKYAFRKLHDLFKKKFHQNFFFLLCAWKKIKFSF